MLCKTCSGKNIDSIDILNISKQVLQGYKYSLEDEEDAFDVKAMCLDASRDLKKALEQHGYKNIKIVQGTFEVDDPDMSNYDDWDEDDLGSGDDFNSQVHNPLHYWLEIDGMVLDITVSQFKDEVTTEDLPLITYGTYANLDRYTKNRYWG